MSDYIKSQILQMQATMKTFVAACRTGAIKDDGKIDSEEAKALKRIEKATDHFIAELQKVIK